jgi:hypothetical protein
MRIQGPTWRGGRGQGQGQGLRSLSKANREPMDSKLLKIETDKAATR